MKQTDADSSDCRTDECKRIRSEPSSRPGPFLASAWGLYDLGWCLAIPVLRHNRRLADGYGQRCLRSWAKGPIDIWIQAASAGESYLAGSLLDRLRPSPPLRVLVTTNTSQGMEILRRCTSPQTGLDIQIAYFPFDRPALMRRAVRHLRPRLAVLLETELWPGHLSALKAAGVKVLVVNGRLTPRSLKGYLSWPAFWHRLSPDRILAISEGDADRFSSLFPPSRVEVMKNVKFDLLATVPPSPNHSVDIGKFFLPDSPFVVFGSVRREEESRVARMIAFIRSRRNDAVIGLFPRHMHRISPWQKHLDRLQVAWRLHSSLHMPVSPGTVILWDTFGALSAAYDRCQACFVGGSLAPLGGQNFLEPVARGILPVIGPHWDNFAWVGREIVRRGLVREAPNWRKAAEALVAILNDPPSRQAQQQAGLAYLQAHCGGSAQACREIEKLLG